ncbi:hypothetical protein [Salinibacterium sp.]|uniref:hypothetical protein n=1 Tax=Salinibacterium sp. TaxID=1915057 RepID=UPI00286A1B4F|nr:hypothetical protein [Salinibacterium sp.]
MPDGSEFLPPVPYQPLWGIIGCALLLAVAAWYVFLFVSTRASRVPQRVSEQVDLTTARTTESVRTHYLQLIDETRIAHASGAVDSRDAHHQLSLLVRSYVTEREGRQTVQMTLSDLRSTPFLPLTKAVEKMYPGSFGAGERGSVDEAVTEARRMVSTWR